MPGLKLEAFAGLIPRSSPRLLPPMAATVARNTKLLNGEVRGFRSLREEANFTAGAVSPVRRAMRVVDNAGVLPDTWLTFDSRDVDIVRSPIINDAHDRYFWAGDGRPMMNTYTRIENDDPGYFLGIPIPQNAPAIAPPAGTDETRAYVYTFESSFGEEGQPSPPAVATGDAGQWDLSGIDTTVPDAGSRDITKVNIYRTVTGGTSSNFYFVDSIALGVSVYADNEASSAVAANPLLESTLWAEPPIDLEGFVVMPNGYLVGWKGRRLVFSEAYRPHAWPAEYELSTEFPIVGLVVWGSTLVIGTKSQPYFGQGTSPLSFTMQKLDAVEPCLSRRGMVATTAGAYYPSVNGLILANSNGAKVITQDILTKEEWATYNPQDIYAAQLGLQYIAFNSQNFGFVFNPTEPATKLIELDQFDDIEGIETDRYSGNVLLLANDRAMEWDPLTSERLNWRWQSKLYHFPEPLNFGAVRLHFKQGEEDVSDDVSAYYGQYNLDLFAAVPSGTAPVIGDPLWDSVLFQADFEGANGATVYTEESQYLEDATFLGASAQLTTTNPIYDTSSFTVDNVASGHLVTFDIQEANKTAWLGAGRYLTAEIAFRFETLPTSGTDVVLFIGDADNAFFQVGLYVSGANWYMRAGFSQTGGLIAIATPTVGVDYFVVVESDYTGGAGNGVERAWMGEVSSGTADLIDTTTGLTAKGIGNLATGRLHFGNQSAGLYGSNVTIDHTRITNSTTGRYGTLSTITIPDPYLLNAGTPAIQGRGLNTINGHAVNGSPAQAIGLVPSWTDPETRQPLGGSLMYPEAALQFTTLALRIIVKTGANEKVQFDKVIYNDDIVRLPTGFKADLWQFDFLGNTDLYSVQIGTTPRALKGT